MTACDQRCGCACGDPATVCACDDRRGPWHPHNPSGLPAIAYRVGDFASFRHDLVRHRDGELALAPWRPTTDSDLALQIVDWWAYIADALTFYSERIANEAYLDTALLPDSVHRLVALLGYRPRPGIGASASLAVMAAGPDPIVLPDRFAVQSKARPGTDPQTFELTRGTAFEQPASAPAEPAEDLDHPATAGAPPTSAPSGTAEPPPHGRLIVRGGVLVKGRPTSIAAGDRLLLIHEPWTAAGDPAAVVTVTALVPEKDPHGQTNTRVQLSGTQSLAAAARATDFRLRRATHDNHLVTVPAGAQTVVTATALVLDSTARFLKAGQPLLLERPGGSDVVRCTSYEELIWYANGVPADPTIVTADTPIPLVVARLGIDAGGADVVTSYGGASARQVTIRSGWVDVGALLDTPVTRLDGLPAKLTLARRPPVAPGMAHKAILEDARGHGAPVSATPAADSSEVAVAADGAVPALQPPLRLLWDLITVTRGESVRDEQLGAGDAALPGQDFKLSRAPVTYLADATDPAATGVSAGPSRSGDGYSSTVELIVDGVRWTEVPMLFGQGPGQRVFATHEDDDGKTHVVTGDGQAGARLPTGARVSANYRTGSGAAVPDAGTLSQVLKPVANLAGVRNPVAALGGGDPDPREKIRDLAPRSVLTFGRAVSHDDYAAVAGLTPGVARAAAAWAWDPGEQRALVRVWVGDDDGAVSAARTALREQADPNRPIVVLPAIAQSTSVRLTLRLDRSYVAADVVTGARAAVTGLFAPGVLPIGEPLHRSRLESVCALPGVLAVHDLLVGHERDFFWFHFDVQSPGPRWFPSEGGFFRLDDLDISWEVDAGA